jgi:hypothetical protein
MEEISASEAAKSNNEQLREDSLREQAGANNSISAAGNGNNNERQ